SERHAARCGILRFKLRAHWSARGQHIRMKQTTGGARKADEHLVDEVSQQPIGPTGHRVGLVQKCGRAKSSSRENRRRDRKPANPGNKCPPVPPHAIAINDFSAFISANLCYASLITALTPPPGPKPFPASPQMDSFSLRSRDARHSSTCPRRPSSRPGWSRRSSERATKSLYWARSQSRRRCLSPPETRSGM